MVVNTKAMDIVTMATITVVVSTMEAIAAERAARRLNFNIAKIALAVILLKRIHPLESLARVHAQLGVNTEVMVIVTIKIITVVVSMMAGTAVQKVEKHRNTSIALRAPARTLKSWANRNLERRHVMECVLLEVHLKVTVTAMIKIITAAASMTVGTVVVKAAKPTRRNIVFHAHVLIQLKNK